MRSAPGRQADATSGVPFDIVVSGFAIHHRPDEEKRRIYAEIFEILSPGGVFLNLEHVASLSPAGEKLFDEFFVDHLHGFHRAADPEKSRVEISATYDRCPDKKENILCAVDTQCGWLREIGFGDIDCFFKVFELAIFGGRKSALPSIGNKQTVSGQCKTGGRRRFTSFRLPSLGQTFVFPS